MAIFGNWKNLRIEFVDLNRRNKETLAIAYQKCELMTLLHEDLFEEFKMTALYDGPMDPQELNLLMYFGLTERPQAREVFQITLQSVTPSEHLSEIRKYISKNYNSSSLLQIDGNWETKFTTTKAIYLRELDPRKKEVYRTILELSLVATGRLPTHFNVLICRCDTSVSQVMAFIYRYFACASRQAFFLVNPEKLAMEGQQEIIELFRVLLTNKIMTSFLFVLYENANQSVMMYFSGHPFGQAKQV